MPAARCSASLYMQSSMQEHSETRTEPVQEHWFALRRVAGDWWDLNSLFPCPRPLSEFYLSAYLATLRDQGYSIFLVQGQLPGPFPDPVAAQEAPGAWFTPEQARLPHGPGCLVLPSMDVPCRSCWLIGGERLPASH